jgi:hypothetical protein
MLSKKEGPDSDSQLSGLTVDESTSAKAPDLVHDFNPSAHCLGIDAADAAKFSSLLSRCATGFLQLQYGKGSVRE